MININRTELNNLKNMKKNKGVENQKNLSKSTRKRQLQKRKMMRPQR